MCGPVVTLPTCEKNVGNLDVLQGISFLVRDTSYTRCGGCGATTIADDAGRARIGHMPAWICVTCGVQQPDTQKPPDGCAICLDERQYVGWDGQRWTTMAEIGAGHASELREEEPGLLGIGVSP